jgi:putative ABC transport system substrate-binding protein
MRRRDFITLMGGTAAAWPLAAWAQLPGGMKRLGALIGGDESDPVRQAWIADFRGALAKLGRIEGRNLRIDWRWAAADGDLAKRYAAELVALKPDVLFGDNTFVVVQLQRATRTLPIVFTHITDPVGSGFVTSLPRPGGNLTGFTNAEPTTLGKLPDFVRQIAPAVTHITILTNGFGLATRQNNFYGDFVNQATSSVGLKGTLIYVNDASDIEKAVTSLAEEPNGALILPGDPVTTTHRRLIFMLAARYKLPVIGGFAGLAADGGLLTYAAKISDQYQGAAGYIDRILKGEKPADLPVQQPTRYELVINLKTAKALGLTVPQPLLITADEVIE